MAKAAGSRRKKTPAPLPAANSLLPKHSIVAVRWLDAAFDLDKEEPVIPLTTIGYLIRQDAAAVVIASEGNPSAGFFRAFTAIPAGMVQDLQELFPAP